MKSISAITLAAALSCSIPCAALAADSPVVENRSIELTQTVTLHDVPEGTKQIRLWVPVPTDSHWQRVTELEVVSAPGEWRLMRQPEGRGHFLYVEVKNPKAGPNSVVVSCKVERQGVLFHLDSITASAPIQHNLFNEHLVGDAVHMTVDSRIKEFADRVCGDERDPARQAAMLLRAVADAVNHYSKDKSVPECGVGSASNCLDQGGGCCTDLHALFVALARAREIPTRIQFGYRTLSSREGQTFDPSYRCWVEFFVPGTGWVPTDIVASDGADPSNPNLWGSLSATRVWLWEGRSFELNPPSSAGPIHTMTCGWAEIDGVAVDPLPDHDGKPAQLRRTIQFKILGTDRTPQTPKLPE
ncbi:MAG TPA: transglutaminase-like domain-containing protein [Phycisphaerales bacterium]|nr:transglutaminase-like domain-containing protein [Phycisphaerales bacterium]HRQ75195.1 transglutaminase-like domain-containing protein [Phycisphaerales bacterium]